MTKCKQCGYIDLENPKGWTLLSCDKCVPYKDEIGLGGTFMETQYIPSYGRVLKSRIREVLRRKILPVTPTEDGVSYYVGRKMENGTIAEREPNY